MNILQKKILFVLSFSASIVTSTISSPMFDLGSEVLMQDSDFRAKNPELTKEYDQAREKVLTNPSYQKHEAADHEWRYGHVNVLSQREAWGYYWAGSLPYENVRWRGLGNIASSCNESKADKNISHKDCMTPVCVLYTELKEKYDKRQRELPKEIYQHYMTYTESDDYLNFLEVGKKVTALDHDPINLKDN